jgi:hypothetical protein
VSTVQKAIGGLIAVAMVTTVILPGRQTPAVLQATTQLTTGALSTVEGTSSGAI